MIVDRIKLKNWRNFLEVDVALTGRVFLIGPNASGKSNFLDVFRFLKDIATAGGLHKAIDARGGVSKIRCLSARKSSDIEIEVHLSNGDDENWTYAIGITQKGGGITEKVAYLRYERVFKNGELLLDRPNNEDKEDELRLIQTHLEQISANRSFRELKEFFEKTSYLHLIPQLVRHAAAFANSDIPGDPYGKNFIWQIAEKTKRSRNTQLEKIEKALKLAVPQLSSLEIVFDERKLPHLEVVYEHWRAQGAKQREDQLSDGTLRLLGLMWALLDGDGLLLLEEPELSLHAGIARKLAPLIHSMRSARNRQVLISTHSAELLSDRGIATEEVLLLQPAKEGTLLQSAAAFHDIRKLVDDGMSIGEVALPRTEPDFETLRQLELFS